VRASLRVRVVALATAVVAVVLAVTAIGVVVDVRRQWIRDLDRSLERRAEEIASEIAAGSNDPLAASNTDDRFAQIVDATGTTIDATPNVSGVTPLAPPPGPTSAAAHRKDVPIADDTFRVLTRRLPDGGYVVVGENVDDVNDDQRALIATLGLALPLAVGALAVAMWWLVGRTLRPVESIRAEVAAIGVDELDRRVAVPNTGDEIARLAATMNEMLGRLDRSVAQQRAFVADASHELRTPLTRLRTSLEVELATAERGDGPPVEAVEVCRRALADTIAMQQLVDDLLFLARNDARPPTDRTSPVDLDAVVEEEVRRSRDEARRGIEIVTPAIHAMVVVGSPADLGRAVSNVLSNARRHARHHVVVTLTRSTDGAAAVLTVDDDGPGIPRAERERVFDRFVRLDAARTPTIAGAGLGLSIVRDIVVAHGGTVTVDQSPAGGCRVTITIPSSGAAATPLCIGHLG
jgi:signal transduction histidine kinase